MADEQTEHTTPFLTLDTIADGAAPSLFERALQDVMANIRDPNTDHKAKRKIVIEVEFVSDENREMVALRLKVGAKVAPPKGKTGMMFLGQIKGGELVATAFNPRQSDLFEDETATPDVTPLPTVKEA